MLPLAIVSLLLRVATSTSLAAFDEQCLFQNVCKEESDRTTRSNISLECCSPCSCSGACTLTGICCPGHNNALRHAPRFPCRKQSHIYEKYLNRSTTFVGGFAYRVIDECPVKYESEGGNEEIISRCKSAKTAVDLIFVTGRLSGLTYLNEHCARCNGEYDFVNWDLYLFGMDNALVFSSFEERDDILLRTGHFKMIPPSSHVALLSFCETKSITRCNVTGLWDYYDRDLEKACLSYHSYLSVDLNMRDTFLNVYCVMCNYPKGTRALKQCSTLNEINKFITRGGSTVFSGLLIPSKKRIDFSVPVQKTCSAGEVRDTVMDRCTPLICPPGTIPGQGICQPAMQEIRYVVLLRLKLMIDVKAEVQPDDHSILLADLEHFTKMFTSNSAIKCDLCGMNFVQMHDDTMSLELTVVSGEKCDYLALLENMFLSYKTLPVVVFLENLKINVTLSYGIADVDYTLIKYMQSKVMRYAQICHINTVYAPTVVHCPSLIFNKANVSEKCNDSCFNTKVDPFSFHLGNGTYIICIDHYKKALMNQACSIGFDKSVIIILLAFYSLITLIHP